MARKLTWDEIQECALFLKGENDSLLNHGEEISLGRRIQKGLAAQKRLDEILEVIRKEEKGKKRRKLVKEYRKEKEKLAHIIQDGVEAKQVLVQQNRRLVANIAKTFLREWFSFTLDDLLPEGVIGLCIAADRYDPELGWRFSTYATYWIEQRIQREIANNCRSVRIPVHVLEAMEKCFAIKMRLKAKLGRDPSREELGAEAGFSAKEVENFESLRMGMKSLDNLLSAGEEFSLNLALEDEDSAGSPKLIEHSMRREAVEVVLRRLAPRERKIIRLRYGLDQEGPMGLKEIGHLLKISKERVRQLQNRGLKKLRKAKEILPFAGLGESA